MPEFLTAPFLEIPHDSPALILMRLVLALVLGGAVAAIYRHTRLDGEIPSSFPTTLVLLAVLIAIVTQVIGDNVARAFSLVGALSIVRFRTVVRDTQDTAFVIFAVVTGMAVGAHNLWVGVLGLGVVAVAAGWSCFRARRQPDAQPVYLLTLRLGLAAEPDTIGGAVLNRSLLRRELLSVGIARQGAATEFIYETRLAPGISPDRFIRALNQTEGVQGAELRRRDFEEP